MNDTNCLTFELRLNEILDARGNPHADNVIVDHATECAECDRYLSAQVRILDIVNTVGLATCEKPRTASCTSNRRRLHGWSIGAALSVCVIIGFVLQGDAEQSDTEQPTLMAQIPSTVNVPGESIPTPPADIDERSTTMMVAMDGAVESWNQFLASSTENAEWLEPVATPIRPLADSMTSTFNVLRKTMPGVRRMQEQPQTERLDSAQRLLPQISLA